MIVAIVATNLRKAAIFAHEAGHAECCKLKTKECFWMGKFIFIVVVNLSNL